MKNVVSLVLGGGRGSRLFPLTQVRSKPAVPVAGKYRLIDIPLSNCINSGLNKIYVITQFNSVSLHQHIRRSYGFDRFNHGFVEILAAQQTIENNNWYQGTADAVRQNLRYLQQPGIDYVLILSGDQLYRMNFREMLETHVESKAEVTIAGLPVHSSEASGLGVMRVDNSGRVKGFVEKPTSEEELATVRTEPGWIDTHGIHSGGRDCLASMGIYLFSRDTLVKCLEKTTHTDFGRGVFPASVRANMHVQLHLFDGYWEDIGTIKSFFDANLELATSGARFSLNIPEAPIYTRARFLPPSRVDGSQVSSSLIADGCIIEEGAVIENCVIGNRCIIGKNAVIRNSILMGHDYFENDQHIAANATNGLPPLGIGAGSHIEGAIIDKNCSIGENVRIINTQGVENTPETEVVEQYMIRDKIVVVPKGTVLPSNWSL